MHNVRQLISNFQVHVPPRSKINFNFEFNTNGVSDIDSLIDQHDNIISPYLVMGSQEFRTSNGLAGGKLLFEIESFNSLDSRSTEYTMIDHDLVLDLEIENNNEKSYRIKITNCYLYNQDGQNLLQFERVMELFLYPQDYYIIKIMIGADGTVNSSSEFVEP